MKSINDVEVTFGLDGWLSENWDLFFIGFLFLDSSPIQSAYLFIQISY